MAVRIDTEHWGEHEGSRVDLVTLTNDRGITLRATNLGATLVGLDLPDRHGHFADVLLGRDDLAGYQSEHPYFGCIVGRCANRIAGAAFDLDGERYELAANNGAHHLHGGPRGFHTKAWTLRTHSGIGHASVQCELTSPDGDEGYPGALRASVVYTLNDDDELHVTILATTDAPTLCNLAQHAYWNLAGQGSGHVLDHLIQLEASHYLPVDAGLVPTGAWADVTDTPFDFRTPRRLGDRIDAAGGDPAGYDHDFVIHGEGLRRVAKVTDPQSGRTLELQSDQPGCQLYSGNFLQGARGKNGVTHHRHAGFCLETQHHPDAVHHPAWPSPVLRPGQTYRHLMVYRFGVED